MGRKEFVVGIDEVGRGALCGPVTVAAFVFLPGSENSTGRRRRPKSRTSRVSTVWFANGFPKCADGIPLRDSKRLTPRARGVWFRVMKERACMGEAAFAAARVSPGVVDRVNITNAANLAATRAYERLVANTGLLPSSLTVLLDGGLFIRPRKALAPRVTRTLVRGDERVPEIQLASIAAKVMRDRAMVRFHTRHPRYGLAAHKGYGTRTHRRALAHHGPVKGLHRSTFIGFLSDRSVGVRKSPPISRERSSRL